MRASASGRLVDVEEMAVQAKAHPRTIAATGDIWIASFWALCRTQDAQTGVPAASAESLGWVGGCVEVLSGRTRVQRAVETNLMDCS